MTDAIAIIGQSNAEILWDQASPSNPAAYGDTFSWPPPSVGGATWGVPLNSLKVFCNKLRDLIGGPIHVIPQAIGGTALGPNANNFLYWLPGGTLFTPFINTVLATGVNLRAIWWWQGEYEASTGVGTSTPKYLAGLVNLQAATAYALGKAPSDLPFIVTPIAGSALPHLADVNNAQFQASKYAGLLIGPPCSDLVTYDGIHLDGASRDSYCTRMAFTMAAVLGQQSVAPSGVVRSIALNSEINSVPSVTYRSIVTGLSGGGSNIRFRLQGPTAGTMQLLHMSVGVRASGANTVAVPVEITFNSGQHGVTVGPGQSVVSDLVPFSFAQSDSLVVICSFGATNDYFRYASPAASGVGSYYKSGVDDYNVASVSGYTLSTTYDSIGFDQISAV